MAARFYEGLDLERMTQLFRDDYLTSSGWLNSAETKSSVGSAGPVPWMTYSSIAMIDRIARYKSFRRVIEFGCGGSTLWWKERTQQIVSVEHDPAWAAETKPHLREIDELRVAPPGTEVDIDTKLKLAPYLAAVEAGGFDTRQANGDLLDCEYEAYVAPLLCSERDYFDVIVIDGVARNLLAVIAAERIGDDGFVVFDNSDRECYERGFEALRKSGLAQIDFWGPGPINPYGWCTSIFCRSLDLFRFPTNSGRQVVRPSR